MNRQFCFDISPNDGEEFFKKDEDNICQIRVQLPNGQLIAETAYTVELSLSKNAMIELGMELIRAAVNENNTIWHLRPSEKTFSSQCMGIYLHPKSCQLLVCHCEMGSLDDIFLHKVNNQEETKET